jgi:uncharacterized protein (TIGR03437 family)
MNFHRGFLVSFIIGAIPSFGGTVQQLPALPNGAVAQALQVDSAGNIYVAGSLPPKSPKSSADTSDAFVAKLSPDGSKTLYFTVLGGSGADAATALAVGSDDSVDVTGTTSSSDFPVTPGALQTVYGGQMEQAFAAKLDPSGVAKYATYIGGKVDTAGVGIAVDSAGDAFVLGSGGPTGLAQITGDAPMTGGFVIKLDPTGSKILMGFTGLGGQYMAVDGQGSVYLAGAVSPPFTVPPFTPGAFQTAEADLACDGNSFFEFPCTYEYAAKADATGTKLIYLTGLNGMFGATPAGIAVDAEGNAIIAGTTQSPDFPVTPNVLESVYAPVVPPIIQLYGPGALTVAPPATGFVAKLNATGSALIWSTFFGGSTSDSITSMNLDSEGDIIVAGRAGSSDLPGLADAPAGCRPSPIQQVSFAARLTPDATSASPAQLFYGASTYSYGVYNATGPIAIASSALGSVIGLEKSGAITAADLFAPSRLACVTDPADNVQLSSVAPGQDLTIFGMTLAQENVPPGESPTLPRGLSVTFNGIAAANLYTSSEQANVQVPAQIAGQTTTSMEVINKTTTLPLDEIRALSVVAQQPSVFLTAEALAGAEPSCNGSDGPQPLAVALNMDGSVNSAGNPAAAGSLVTFFLNGVVGGRLGSPAATGMANDSPATFTPAGFNEGVMAVSFQVPPSGTNGVSLSQLQAGGVAVRETLVAVCVKPVTTN